MNWNEIEKLIRKNISNDVHIDTQSEYRYIIKGPEYHCNSKKFEKLLGYKVQIGKDIFIEIPFEMLRAVYKATIMNKGIYNRAIIYEKYPQQVKNHGCYVHVVGKIFEVAGIMKKISSRQFIIL